MNGKLCRGLGLASWLVLGLSPWSARAAGLGNLTYTQAELEKPIANFGGEEADKWASGPTGSNTLLMLRDVCVIMGSNDSGAPPGSFHIYDLKDPRSPKLLKTYDGTAETKQLRELHAMPVAMIDGKDFLVAPSTKGLQFFDFTDPVNPKPSGAIELTGVNGGDYDNAVWMLSWAWPYVYAGSTGSGVFVVDATDPAAPKLVTQIVTGELGNFRVGPAYAAGNYVIVANMDQATTHFSVIDVGDPKQPFLSATASAPVSLYSALVVGDRIYGAGTNGDYAFLKWNPTTISPLKSGKSGSDRGGYCTFQSGFTICGQSSEGYKKWDTRDENAPKLVGHGTDPNAAGGDFDFATVLGNLVYLGNDHGSGSALVPHSMMPDSTPPEVVNVYPSNGDTKQPLTSRITVFFSEDVDLDSVKPENLVVRVNGGDPVPGVLSRSSFNAISFGAKAPLSADTTYEVSFPKGGLTDLVGNAIGDTPSVRFSTGTTVDGAVPDPDPVGGSGGVAMGGMSGMSGMSSAGTPSQAGTAGASTPMAGGNGGGPSAGGSPGAGEPSTAGKATSTPYSSDSSSCRYGRAASARSLWLLPAALGLGLALRRRRRAVRTPQA